MSKKLIKQQAPAGCAELGLDHVPLAWTLLASIHTSAFLTHVWRIILLSWTFKRHMRYALLRRSHSYDVAMKYTLSADSDGHSPNGLVRISLHPSAGDFQVIFQGYEIGTARSQPISVKPQSHAVVGANSTVRWAKAGGGWSEIDILDSWGEAMWTD